MKKGRNGGKNSRPSIRHSIHCTVTASMAAVHFNSAGVFTLNRLNIKSTKARYSVCNVFFEARDIPLSKKRHSCWIP